MLAESARRRQRGRRDAPCADISRTPVRGAERFDADNSGRIRRMHEAVGTNRDGNVRRTITVLLGVEENQIARLDVGRADRVADFVLLLDDTRNGNAVLREDVLHETAAVEAAGIGATRPIWHATESQ